MSSKEWWGDTAIERGSTLAWCIGPLRLHVSRLEGEWRVAYQPGEAPSDASVEVARPCDAPLQPTLEPVSVERFAVNSKSDRLSLLPLTADRTVVSRPSEPFNVLPDHRVRLFVSSPLWVGLELDGERLCELPILRPSDTWIGSTTSDGELAYASRTACRLRIGEVPFRPHRAITPVVVANRAPEKLTLERISIAVPYLSLYVGPGSILWTEEVRLTRDADKDEVEMEIRPGAPPEVGDGALVRAARLANRDGLRRALSAIF